MKRFWGIVSGAVLLCTAAPTVSAQSFDGLAEKAADVRSGAALAALFWSHNADCSKQSGDVARRQCEAIRDARQAQLASATFLVEGDSQALEAGDFDGKSVPLTIRGCVACATPVAVGGSSVHVVAGDKPFAGGKAGALITRRFAKPDAKAAASWVSEVAPRLTMQMVIQIGDKPKAFKSGSAAGYQVSLLGYRVYDRCTGKIVTATPKSSSVAPDKRYCSGEPVEEKTAQDAEPAKPKEPELPASLTPGQIRDALEPARQAARKCFEAYGVPGTARFRITIANSGDVVGLRQKGDYVDTPTGNCIERAVKSTTFPKSRRAKTTIDYPFILR